MLCVASPGTIGCSGSLAPKEVGEKHTTQNLIESSFAITVDGREAGIQDVFPGFDNRDRLGVVVRSPCGATGASALILAAVTAFYELQRQRSDDFFIYPDYFVFHAGGPVGDHKMFDIFFLQATVLRVKGLGGD